MLKTQSDQGLYTPELEHDSCGIGLIAELSGNASHKIIQDGLSILERMEHRGATGSDPNTGDGAGIMIQLPHTFLKKVCLEEKINLPEHGQYAVGMLFLPANEQVREACIKLLERHIEELGLKLLGYRAVPVDHNVPGIDARRAEPVIRQVFVQPIDPALTGDALERKLLVLRNYTTHTIGKEVPGNNGEFYIPSFSASKLIYKGQLKTEQLRAYYMDLNDPDIVSAYALLHSRFSTNTFPNWKLAQPFRFMAHNGEINTIKGNLNKMRSKEALFESEYFTREELDMLLPITDISHSDSANLDALVEMLVLAGRSIPHVMTMLIPEAWQDNKLMETDKKSFYKYHASIMEPWDGPAAVTFAHAHQVGCITDRNGLRPACYTITKDGRFILSSETGVIDLAPDNIEQQGRVKPGKMVVADLREHRVLFDEEIKRDLFNRKPYHEWITEHRFKLKFIPDGTVHEDAPSIKNLFKKQLVYGLSREDISRVIIPMVDNSKEPIGSMGLDSPLAVLSSRPQHISNYFKQFFAQVSNPPIDPIREQMVMSLFTRIGEGKNMLTETPEHCRQVHISHPVLRRSSFNKIKKLNEVGYNSITLEATFVADGQTGRLEEGLNKICTEAEQAIEEGYSILIISNRKSDKYKAPIPSLLAIGAVHHYLVKNLIRTKAGLVLESGDIWETHHFATAIGFGASAVYPYLAYNTIGAYADKEGIADRYDILIEHYRDAVGKGLLKIMSKMGISTLQSYQAAQIFECIGLSKQVINRCFKGTTSRLDGLSFDDLAEEALMNHRQAYAPDGRKAKQLPEGGIFQWKRDGEKHLLNPDTIATLQKAVKLNDYQLFKEYSSLINDQREEHITLRSLLGFKVSESIDIDEVESAENIMKRFNSGAMSFGSLSYEAHSTLAVAMNRIGGRSNSGEGGEDEARYVKKLNGNWERSAVKQVASGRFGVTSHYLTNADEIQIKMAQGAKPGEGGQLPGFKVDEWIARVRHATPGVGLISPPPHHDIYSIEDLKQLIFDLKNANPGARINVKLVSEAGVGTIAAGVAKAKAEAIMISGYDGGTGASPLSSIRHAGLPWELGVAEAHQTLVKNNLRNRVTLQADGKMLTGRDIAIATLLGAEEWGVATAALIAEGCIMMRKCHLNTCPVGVATQNPELRKLFTGDPDHVVNLFRFITEELREIMAELGFRTINEMVGQSQHLKPQIPERHWKIRNLDLSPILFKEHVPNNVGLYKQIDQEFELQNVHDQKLIELAQDALDRNIITPIEIGICNTDRSTGAMLSNRISKRFGSNGLGDRKLHFKFKGSAGQSFGAFLVKGLQFELEGTANDYVGKGLSGGEIVVYPNKLSTFPSHENAMVGNVCLYGATSGTLYVRGMAGARFAVRNSGATAVVEGVGDHGCEYMTGGRVIILGKTGKNFAAGMSGGIAYVLDKEKQFMEHCNLEMVAFDELEDAETDFLKRTVSDYQEKTGSQVAEHLLNKWEDSLQHFVKVMPHDYKAVLEKRKAQMKEVV